ncbi:MAG TPA: hypothetical protein DER32_05235 [Deinococcus radiodurans]|nr:hypothetical protein DXG80_00150 [Deinococcus radiodurans]HCE64503.1 hypothetical protein [Deinococcus radiodurans]
MPALCAGATDSFMPLAAGQSLCTDSASFQHSRKSAACASIPQNPYFFLLASARIESSCSGFNRNLSYSA